MVSEGRIHIFGSLPQPKEFLVFGGVQSSRSRNKPDVSRSRVAGVGPAAIPQASATVDAFLALKQGDTTSGRIHLYGLA